MASNLVTGEEPDTACGIDRLFIAKSWFGSLCLIFLGVIVSFLLFGYWNPYWRFADMDLMMVYQGFLLNDGKPQDFFDHPGHLHVVLIDGWFWLLHWLGALDVVALSQIPGPSDVFGFEHVWTAAVRAGRVLSLLIALLFVGVFAKLVRRLVVDWRLAALATFMLAFSTGVTWQALQLRTDLLASGLSTTGLLLLLLAARSPRSSWRPVVIGIAAMLCTLGMVNKVHSIFMTAAWPVVVLFFGVQADEFQSLWRQPARAAAAIIALSALVVLAAIPAAHLFEVAFTQRATSVFRFPPPPFGILGLYQAILACYVAAAIIAFAWVWRVPVLETLATLLTVALGVLTGLLSMFIIYHPQNPLSVINFIEHMFVWASISDPKLAAGGGILSMTLLKSLVAGLIEEFAHFTFVFHTSSRATMFLQWLVIVGMGVAWVRGRRLLVAQVAVLLATAWGVDIAGSLRGAKIAYDIFSDPIIIIAAAWLLANLPELLAHRLAFPIGAILMTLQVVLGQFEVVKASLVLRRSPQSTCEWLPARLKLIERFPYCPPPA